MNSCVQIPFWVCVHLHVKPHNRKCDWGWGEAKHFPTFQKSADIIDLFCKRLQKQTFKLVKSQMLVSGL